jgi:outer membrane receptor protein involved in Fe transport
MTLQASAFARYSSLAVHPDPVGDLLYAGAARGADNTDATAGLQLEGLYRLGAHALRGGVVAGWAGARNDETAQVLPVDGAGRQTSDVPLTVEGRFHEARQTTSVFLQDEWALGGGFILNPGLRFDHVQAAGGGDQASPRISLVWSGGGTTAHAGYARYFVPAPEQEAPASSAALAGTTGALPGQASDPLRAETDDYLDLGIERKAGGLTLGLDGYWRSVRDLIDEVRVGATSLRRPFNYAHGKVAGVELSATYAKGPVTLWANLAAARAEGRTIVSNQALFTAAELAWASDHDVRTDQDQGWTASAGGAYRLDQLTLSTQLAYGSGLPRTSPDGPPNGASMPAHVQVDLSATYHTHGIAAKPVDLRLDLINAFDSRYQLRDGTSLGGGAPEWGPRRAVLVGIEHGF